MLYIREIIGWEKLDQVQFDSQRNFFDQILLGSGKNVV